MAEKAEDAEQIAYLKDKIAHKLTLPKYAHLAKEVEKSTPKAKKEK